MKNQAYKPLKYVLSAFIILLSLSVQAQQLPKPYVETITRSQERGIRKSYIDSMYKSAVHVDSTKAVFKPGAESDSLINAYHVFLQELGNYLKANDFKWEQPTRCWNRVYFAADGTVECYLFEFKTDIGSRKADRYKELFSSFIKDHKIKITAREPFAQCSPVVYMDK